MGYTTRFRGSFSVAPPLPPLTVVQMNQFAAERHEAETDGDGGYPSYYCDWAVTDHGAAIYHNGNENSYCYVAWLCYVIQMFVSPAGSKVNGSVKWRGEDFDDLGTITVKDNVVTSRRGWK